jgi:hypothetical protein
MRISGGEKWVLTPISRQTNIKSNQRRSLLIAKRWETSMRHAGQRRHRSTKNIRPQGGRTRVLCVRTRAPILATQKIALGGEQTHATEKTTAE